MIEIPNGTRYFESQHTMMIRWKLTLVETDKRLAALDESRMARLSYVLSWLFKSGGHRQNLYLTRSA